MSAHQTETAPTLELDPRNRKIMGAFPGKTARKDTTSLMKRGVDGPTLVLEYLLLMYSATDDQESIEQGLDRIRASLAKNYVRPDDSERTKPK